MSALIQAIQHLANGPVGLGEHHDKPQARQVVLELLQRADRPVENFFVEVPETKAYKDMIGRAVQRFTGGGTEAQVAQTMYLGTQPNSNTNTLESVIAAAIVRNVPVHCVDDRIAVAGNRGNAARNPTIYKNFNNITGGNEAHCLLLFGSDHFDRDADPPTLVKLFADGGKNLLYLKLPPGS